MNPMANIRKKLLSPLTDLAKGANILLATGQKPGSEPKKDLGFGNLVEIKSWNLEDQFWGRLDTQLQVGINAMMLVLRARGMTMTEGIRASNDDGGSINTSQAYADLCWHKDAGAPHNENSWAGRVWRPLEHLLRHEENGDTHMSN
jgi:hypothetical protein